MIDEKKLIEEMNKTFPDKFLNDKNWFCGKCSFMDLFSELIENQPKVGEWISCSERLPTEKEAWDYNEEEGIHEPNEFIVQVKGAELPTVAMFDGEEFTHGYADDGYGFFDEIIAWMPLPEPYKEDK